MKNNKIRVLFAPANTASMPDITMQALNRLDTIEAKGISFGKNKYWTFGPNWTIIDVPAFKTNPVGRLMASIKQSILHIKAIIWADILMWHWDIDFISLIVVKLLKKKIFVEWIGSDIRVPDYLFKINPYYKKAWKDGEWTYNTESKKRSKKIQGKFKFLDAQIIVCPEISLFLDATINNNYISYMQRIDLRNYKPNYPNTNSSLPIIAHTPSATGAKGTKYVQETISKLTKEGFKFKYIEIHNKTREEALAAINACDIFIDQFIVGSYGLATCEAMAMGKPVFCYIMNEVAEKLPSSCPIVNTSIDTLEANLIKYIQNPELRNQQGILGRKFVEEYHDADKIALDLEKLFQEKLKK